MRIAFCWTGGIKNKDRFDHWNDGLRAAMRLIEQEHEVTYHEPEEDLPTVDWILLWEAPCTHASEVWGNAYKKVQYSPQKKALLFAGGPIQKHWVDGFDHVFVESLINKDDFTRLGVKNSVAFGINTNIFKPLPDVEKIYTTVTHGTCAGWKRQNLVGEAFKDRALVFGQPQDTDPKMFDDCRNFGCTVLLEQTYENTNILLNSGQVSVNCADFWGGGQRSTLEALACDLPVVVMADSPKNREYIEASGCGYICNPDVESIKRAVNTALSEKQPKSREYVMKYWTPEHYKNALLNVIS